VAGALAKNLRGSGMKSGALEFLLKRFRPQELLDAVQQALDRDRVLARRMRKMEADSLSALIRMADTLASA